VAVIVLVAAVVFARSKASRRLDLPG
jgi:hypothetical protein